jgi:beta-lactamase superfamily II metal-dependent hydrolase
MPYEVDYLAVGEGERSADAICLRYGNLNGPRAEQTVITVDGGTLESGEKIVEHVKTHYKTDTVDIALLTHADTDHASGVRPIIEKLRVHQLAMHLPWNHSSAVKDLLDDSNVTVNSLREKAKRNLSAAREIEQLARSKNIPIIEPFAGTTNQSGFVVLGPTREYYQELLCSFKFMPGLETKSLAASIAELLKTAGAAVTNWIDENWFTEHLSEPEHDAISAENNSSLIFLLEADGRKLLFSGDAGVPALNAAIDFAGRAGISLAGISFFHVPHHGSRRNIGPSVLNRLFGTIRMQESVEWTAFISAAKDGRPKHPHKKVTNALRRRGAAVHVTAGQNIWHYNQAPVWMNYSPIVTLPLYQQVENDDD